MLLGGNNVINKISKYKHFTRIRKHKKIKQKFDNYKLALGLIGEKCVNAVTSMIYPKKKGYIIQHSNWLEYNYSSGTDIKVYDCNGRFLLDIEVKNWQFFVRSYGTSIIESEIFDRFEKLNKIKYLDGWVAIKNFIKYQKLNPNIEKGIKKI